MSKESFVKEIDSLMSKTKKIRKGKYKAKLIPVPQPLSRKDIDILDGLKYYDKSIMDICILSGLSREDVYLEIKHINLPLSSIISFYKYRGRFPYTDEVVAINIMGIEHVLRLA